MGGLVNPLENMMGVKQPQPAPVYTPPPPTPPANDTSAQAQQQQAADAEIAAMETGGKASTILTGPTGVTKEDDNETIARKALLGSA